MRPVWPHGDPRVVARAILADHRYQIAPQGPAPKSLWQRAIEWLYDWWTKLMRPLGHALGNDKVTTVVGLIVLALALLFLIFVAVRFVRVQWKRRARVQGRRASALQAVGDARTLFEQALAAAAAGRQREAAALLWGSALRALDERGRIRFDAARTPGEWRRAVHDPAFDRLTRDAVLALFGDHGVDAALVARMRSAYDALLSGA